MLALCIFNHFQVKKCLKYVYQSLKFFVYHQHKLSSLFNDAKVYFYKKYFLYINPWHHYSFIKIFSVFLRTYVIFPVNCVLQHKSFESVNAWKNFFHIFKLLKLLTTHGVLDRKAEEYTTCGVISHSNSAMIICGITFATFKTNINFMQQKSTIFFFLF